MRYLDPKSDLVFKRVFGEHANILTSFLNAVLPLDDDQLIEHIEYLPAELLPEISIAKNSIVDVRCKDSRGRQFIVEMQMLWTESFTSRVVFNTSKAYIKQLLTRNKYAVLNPVYSLSLVNERYEKEIKQFYHHYQLSHHEIPNKKIDDIHLVFIEIPKFEPNNYAEKKLMVLWLRFLSEIQKGNDMIDEDLIKELRTVPEIAQALDIAEASGYTEEELLAYDKFWDAIRTEKSLISDAEKRGDYKRVVSVIVNGISNGLRISSLAAITNLSEEEVLKIIEEHKVS